MNTLHDPSRNPMFLHCRCPGCRRPFDFVPVDADECPFCRKAIDAAAVWETRRYPGIVMLPGWVRAFGWPFLLIVAGLRWFYFSAMYTGSSSRSCRRC